MLMKLLPQKWVQRTQPPKESRPMIPCCRCIFLALGWLQIQGRCQVHIYPHSCRNFRRQIFPSRKSWLGTNWQYYCWWLKSCTSWYGKYPIIYRVSYIPGGAGFQPSTVGMMFPYILWLSKWHPKVTLERSKIRKLAKNSARDPSNR